MRGSGRKLWFSIHSASGVLLGLMLFIICWTGSFAVLSREIDWLLNPAIRAASSGPPASWGRLEAATRAAMPEGQLVSITRPAVAGGAAEAVVNMPDQELVRVYLDPVSGDVQGTTSFFNVQRFFRSFHRELFAVWGFGRWIVVAVALPLLLSAIAPLIFYRRWWRGFFRLELRKGLRTAMSGLHKLVGLWSLWFAALIGLTGAWWAAEYMDVDLGYPGMAQVGTESAIAPDEKPVELTLDRLAGAATAAWPDLVIQAVYFPAETPSALLFYGDDGTFLVRDTANQLMVSRQDGTVIARQQAAELGWPTRWIDTVDPLHFGTFGGLATKLVWFLFGLGLASLCLTGAYLHYRRRVMQPAWNDRARWPATSAAVTVILMTLVATAGAGWEEFVSYGPMVEGVQQAPTVPGGVTAFLIGWMILTLAIILAWTVALSRPHGLRTRKSARAAAAVPTPAATPKPAQAPVLAPPVLRKL